MSLPEASSAWWESAVIYQIYPRSYSDTNGDGIGDLTGISRRLPYLAQTLQVDAIWISPFFTSPMKDFGYDVANFKDVDPLFGTLSDAESLIRQTHDHGMRVILDYVSNHSSDRHPWFIDSRTSRDSEKRDWYVWRDPASDGGPPNNWLSVFGGPAWAFDDATGQFYLHSFLSSQPDLNWRNPALRQAMHDVVKFWIDRGVDGFRIDAAHFVGKDEALRDNPPAPTGSLHMHRPMGAYDSQIHLYDKGTDFAHEVYRDIRSFVDQQPNVHDDCLLIGEMHIYDWDEWASYFGSTLNEFHLPYNFGLLLADWTAASVRGLIETIERVVPDDAWPNWVIGNHDEARVATRIGPDAARAAMALLLTLRGTPTIYYGDELGMPDANVPPDRMQDPWGLQMPELNTSRDPQRSPMPWQDSPNGGFTEDDATPWLPMVDTSKYSVEAELDDPGSMLTLTRRLLQLRKQRPSLQSGDIQLLEDLPADCLGYARRTEDEQTHVLMSFSEDVIECTLADVDVLLSTSPSRERGRLSGIVSLKPFEAIIASM